MKTWLTELDNRKDRKYCYFPYCAAISCATLYIVAGSAHFVIVFKNNVLGEKTENNLVQLFLMIEQVQ